MVHLRLTSTFTFDFFHCRITLMRFYIKYNELFFLVVMIYCGLICKNKFYSNCEASLTSHIPIQIISFYPLPPPNQKYCFPPRKIIFLVNFHLKLTVVKLQIYLSQVFSLFLKLRFHFYSHLLTLCPHCALIKNISWKTTAFRGRQI